jgi:hypothetical protein
MPITFINTTQEGNIVFKSIGIGGSSKIIQTPSTSSDIQYIVSNGYTSSFGLASGSVITKDMTSGIPAASTIAKFAYPGTNKPPTGSSRYWPDWGNDIFDNWGYFYLYNPATDTYSNPVLSPINTADGVITTQTTSSFGRTFTIKHGYPIQGVFKFDISVNDNDTFAFGMFGDMGSDGGTSNTNLSSSYTLGGQNFTLYYNRNLQTGVPVEILYTYVIPYETDKNKSTPTYTKLSSGPGIHGAPQEVLSIYTVNVRNGVTIYFGKTNDIRTWVVNDLKLST